MIFNTTWSYLRQKSPELYYRTGHNDYKSMKPYIDIVDEIKASEMNKMNFMD